MALGNEDTNLEVSEIVRNTVSHISLDGFGEITVPNGNLSVGSEHSTADLIDVHDPSRTEIGIRFRDPTAADYGWRGYFDDSDSSFKWVTISQGVEQPSFSFDRDSGNVSLESDLSDSGGSTIYDQSASHVPSSRVQTAGLDADTVDGFEAADLRNSSNVLQLSSTNTTLDINQSTWTSIPFDVQQIVDGAFSHDASSSPETITFDEAGRYRVNVSLAFDTGGASRVNPGIKFNLNGTRLDTQGLTGYIRTNDGHDEASNTVGRVIDVSAGDTLKVQSIQQASAGTVTLRANESILTIEQLSASAAPISDAETLDGLDSTAFVKTDGSTPITSAQAISQAEGADYLKFSNTTTGDTWDFTIAGDANLDLEVNNTNVLTVDNSSQQVTFPSRVTGSSGFDAGGNSIDNSTEVNTTGSGTASFDVYDSANGQDIARFNEGGNVEIPNGDLTDGGNIIYDQSASHIPQARLQNDSVTVNAGTDLTTGGSVALGGSVTIDHANTSSQGNVSAPAGGAISDVNLDGNGHVTSLSTVDFDGRFVAESGDSMTGRLSMDGNDIYFQPDSSGGSVTGLTFESNINAGSDFGYIEYHDDYFGDGSGESSAIVLRTENDPTDKIVLDGAGGTYVETGPFDLASNDLEDSGTTIWDTSAAYIPQGRLQNDSLTVAGNSVSLGGSTSVAHSNLTGIGSSDHHSRYADSEAVSAVESNRVQDIGFDNIEDPSRTRAIGIDDSEGPLFKDSGGSTYSLWNSKYVSGGTDISISGGVGAGDGYVTIDHANTSSQGNVSTGGATVIDDIDLDGNGHVININTQNRSLDDWNDANSAINLSGNGIASVGNLNVSSIDSNNGSNPVRIDQALEYQDDTESFFGNNADFSAKYDSSSDEWVLRDETNGVDLIRQPKAGPTQFIQGADIGSIEAPEDSFTQVINAANTSSTTSGDTVGYTFAVDNQSLLSVQAESDGSGGIQNKKLLGPDGSELGGISFPLTFPDNDSDGNNWQIAEDGTNGHLNFTSSGGGGTQMDLEHNGNLRLEGELTEGAAL